MKNVFKISMLILTVLIVSCSKDESATGDIELYTGNWAGTYNGGDSGTFRVLIKSDGVFTGSAYSNDLEQTIPLNGSINEAGNVNAFLGDGENEGSFTGKFSPNSGSGTWDRTSTQASGNWSASRE